MDPSELYRRAVANAAEVFEQVMPEQLTWPTPCSEWSVQDLVDHVTGSTEYLNAALAGRVPAPPGRLRRRRLHGGRCSGGDRPRGAGCVWSGCACRRWALSGRSARR